MCIAVVVAHRLRACTGRLVSAANPLRPTILLPLKRCAAGSRSVVASGVASVTHDLCFVRSRRSSSLPVLELPRRHDHLATINLAVCCDGFSGGGFVYGLVPQTLSTCRAIPCALHHLFAALLACRFGILDLFPSSFVERRIWWVGRAIRWHCGPSATHAWVRGVSGLFNDLLVCRSGLSVAAWWASVVAPSLSVAYAGLASLLGCCKLVGGHSECLGLIPAVCACSRESHEVPQSVLFALLCKLAPASLAFIDLFKRGLNRGQS